MDYLSASKATTEFFGGKIGSFLASLWDWVSSPFQGASTGVELTVATYERTPFFQMSPLKFVIFLVTVSLLILCIYLRIRWREHHDFHKEFSDNHFIKPRVEDVRNERWGVVEKLFISSNESDWRLAIIEADAMLEDMLIHMGFEGESVSERLKQATPQMFPMLNYAWEAHKIRNRIAHDGLNYHLGQSEAWRVYKMFEGVFRGNRYI